MWSLRAQKQSNQYYRDQLAKDKTYKKYQIPHFMAFMQSEGQISLESANTAKIDTNVFENIDALIEDASLHGVHIDENDIAAIAQSGAASVWQKPHMCAGSS